jgi:GNAT superfamily N-acetyltransferase
MIVSPNNDGSLEVDWLDVLPDFQRIGIGTLLVEKAAKIGEGQEDDGVERAHVGN